MHPEVLNVAGAAKVLGVSRWTVLKLARRNELPGKKVGREWRFRLQTLLRWLGEGPSESNGGGSAAPPPTVSEAEVALRGLGYRASEAQFMISRALEFVGRRATVEQLVEQALRKS